MLPAFLAARALMHLVTAAGRGHGRVRARVQGRWHMITPPVPKGLKNPSTRPRAKPERGRSSCRVRRPQTNSTTRVSRSTVPPPSLSSDRPPRGADVRR